MKIFRFESAMFYANAEYFRSTLIEMTRVDPQNPYKHSSIGNSVYYRSTGSPEDSGSPTIEIARSTISVNRALENGVTSVALCCKDLAS